MDTAEVAEYLRLKRRKIYDLVRAKRIPCARVTGKWLFRRREIDAWIAGRAARPEAATASHSAPPPILAGSHDPLLDWAVRESRCGLAVHVGGSLDGLDRLARGEAAIAGAHILDPETGEYAAAEVARRTRGLGVVVVEWARREQGLVVAAGNPLGLMTIADLARPGVRVVRRQKEAGSHALLEFLLAQAKIDTARLTGGERRASNEDDLADAIEAGKADVGIAIRAVAARHGLGFVPLRRERFDLVMRRRDYFEPAVQALLAFARQPAFAERAAELGGYDVSELGRVVYNE